MEPPAEGTTTTTLNPNSALQSTVEVTVQPTVQSTVQPIVQQDTQPTNPPEFHPRDDNINEGIILICDRQQRVIFFQDSIHAA